MSPPIPKRLKRESPNQDRLAEGALVRRVRETLDLLPEVQAFTKKFFQETIHYIRANDYIKRKAKLITAVTGIGRVLQVETPELPGVTVNALRAQYDLMRSFEDKYPFLESKGSQELINKYPQLKSLIGIED